MKGSKGKRKKTKGHPPRKNKPQTQLGRAVQFQTHADRKSNGLEARKSGARYRGHMLTSQLAWPQNLTEGSSYAIRGKGAVDVSSTKRKPP